MWWKRKHGAIYLFVLLAVAKFFLALRDLMQTGGRRVSSAAVNRSHAVAGSELLRTLIGFTAIGRNWSV